MIPLEEQLATGLVFIRKDLYNMGQKVSFGKLTPYPAGVSTYRRFDINDLDWALGE